MKTDINQPYITPCIVLNVSENIQHAVADRGCIKLHYTIGFPTKSDCELFLKIVTDSDVYLNVFYIQQITCPIGFVEMNKRCQCDPVLVQYGITNCNINDQTILRPANSWISATTHNNSYTYHISLHCPFHYCLSHSSRLSFSTPNSPCQFKRSGLLCGHYQHTKILRIVSSVLFFYSTITHLPSKHTTLVWSVDANVPLFGVRFTILFIVCLILFLILVPFNVILLFTRTLSRFRFINKFKPLLDAYQGPYKNTFYYWTGLQLLMRAVFFGISSLDRNINIIISILLLSAIIRLGAMQPFKIKYKTYQEMLLFFNLHGLYVSLLYSQLQGNANSTVVNVAITSAVVHFSFIIVYHMITYVYGGVIRNKIQLSINTLTGWITRLKNRTHTQ